jgi:uncharacterized membrane protein YfcA
MPEVEFSIWGAVLIGLGVGFLAGFLGVGGGFVMVPLVNGFLGVPMNVVAGSSLCQITGTSLSGVLRHRRYGNFDGRVATILIGGMFCGTITGVHLVEYLKGLGEVTLAGGSVAAADLWLRWVFLGMLVAIGASVFWETARSSRRAKADPDHSGELSGGLLSHLGLPVRVQPAGGGRPVSVLLVAYCGVIIGMAQGMLGIGGGVLLIPVLVYLIGVSTHAAVGTSLLVILVSGVFGTFLHATAGNVHLPLVLALLIPSTFGSQFGAILANRLAGHRLRKYFGLLVLAAMLVVAFKLCRNYGLISLKAGTP